MFEDETNNSWIQKLINAMEEAVASSQDLPISPEEFPWELKETIKKANQLVSNTKQFKNGHQKFVSILKHDLDRLSLMVEKITEGNYDVGIPDVRLLELGNIQAGVDDMRKGIKKAHVELEDHAKNLETKVKERTKELEEKNELLSELLNVNRTLLKIVSHDINNPLTVLLNCLQLVQKRGQFEEGDIVDKSLSKMDRASKMISQILNEVKELEALKSGKKKLQLVPIDFKDIINDTMFVFETKLLDKKIKLCYKDKLNGAKINCEKASLTNNVVNNLVSNAIKFSFENDTIDIVAQDMGDKIRVEITDHGTGIPPSLAEKLFDPNTVTSRKGTGGESGTGFGLPIVKEYLNMYGASIEVKSEIMEEGDQGKTNHGTTFSMFFNKA